jgi:iron complex outermembrane recepter protein
MSKGSRGRDQFKVNAITAGCLVALMAASSVQAQAQLDTVTITGIRKGIEDAISVKKNKDQIVESISAEDIGKLPDSSIAESIARLPGVAAQRVNGRATSINIRGLSGDFANTLLNGREQVSTGDNRSAEFDQYPSELLSAVTVYKAPDASLVGQGLSGTIDLQTVRPLNYKTRVVSVNVRGEKNGQGTPFSGNGNRANATYIDQFADRTVGVALGVARLTQKLTKSRNETYDTANIGNFANVNGGQDFKFNQGFKYFVDSTEETRTGIMGAIEFKPTKELSSMVDFFYSKFDKDVVKRGLEIQVNDSWKGGNPNLAYQAPTLSNAVVEGGRLISGTWGNVNPLSRTIWEPKRDELKSAGWNTKWKFADGWSATADLSFSSATTSERITEMEAGQYDVALGRPLQEEVRVTNYGQIAGLQYDRSNLGTLRLTDPESWGQNGYDKLITTDDKLKALRLSAQAELEGMFSKLDFGVNYSKRDKTKGSAENKLVLPGGASSGGALPAGATSVTLPNTGGLSTLSFDPAAAFPSSYKLEANINADILNKGWEVNEKVATLYARADLDTELMGIPVRGNFGVQMIRTDQSSTAAVVDTTKQGQFTLRTAGKTYTDFLPSLNLVFELGGDQMLKAAVGRQMARARMDQLRSFSRSEVNDQLRWTGEGGNPNLDPYRATAFDVSYEKYFGNKGYVSVAAFYKKLASYIFELKNTNFDFTGFPNLSGRTPISNIGEFKQPQNGTGGQINGFEVAASLPLNMLTSYLDGFGIIASYSDTKSKIRPFGDADTRPLPGLSPKVLSLTAYYESHGFSARIASRKRDAFLAEVKGFGGDRGYTFARGETITDMQLGYEFQEGFAKGLSILFQVNNMKNSPYREFNFNSDTDTKLDEYGRTTLLGVTYKF